MKTVLVTGATSGIGLATAKLFARNGYLVVGTTSNLQAAIKRLSASAEGIPDFQLVEMDLADPGSTQKGWESTLSYLTQVDILINNAGYGELGSVEDTPMGDARRLFEVNYFGTVELVKRVLPSMRRRGKGVIINIGSIVSGLQFPFKAQYCAAKSAVTGFTLSLYHEVKPYGIRVHLVEPGWVRSEFHTRLRPVVDQATPYGARLKPFLDFSRDSDPRIPSGEHVSELILDIAENPKAKVRNPVGREAKLFTIASRILGWRLVHRLVERKLVRKGSM